MNIHSQTGSERKQTAYLDPLLNFFVTGHSVKVFHFYCVSLAHEIKWICQLDEVFHGAFTNLGCF